MLGDGAEVYLPLSLAVSLSFSLEILHTGLLHLRSPRPQQTSQRCLLATCHAWSRHKLCANLPWETPLLREMFGQLPGRPVVAEGPGAQFPHGHIDRVR